MQKRRQKSRGNGTGCAYYSRKYRYWVAQVVVGYRPLPPFDPDNPDNQRQRVPIKKTKGGFKTRDDALTYCRTLKNENEPKKKYTLQEVYNLWEPWYTPRVASMAGYKAAFNHFKPLHGEIIDQITPGDLQACMDDCKAGKRTHQMMKVTAGLIWAYATDHGMVEKKITDNLYTGKGRSQKREALTEEEVESIRQAIGTYRYAEYIYCLCYLGYRPGEMLELRKDQVIEDKDRLFLVEGKKTEAGRDRIVPVHQKIEPIIRDRLFVPGTDLIFPQLVHSKISKKNPIPLLLEMKEMSDSYFRESVFKPMMAALGIAEGKVPYGARHTFSNKLKKAAGEDIDKAALMGHSNYTFTQTAYQSTDLDELKAVVDSIA